MQWASSFDVFCYLDSNNFSDQYSKFGLLLAVGVKEEITVKAGSAFDELELFRQRNPGWITGFFTYDLKNEVENLASGNPDHLHFPDLYFFVPEHLILIKNGEVEIIFTVASKKYLKVYKSQTAWSDDDIPYPVQLSSRFSKEEYIDTVVKIKEHINRGDIYVTNFCQEFFAEDAQIDPLADFFSKAELIGFPLILLPHFC